MRKSISILLLIGFILSLAGCGAGETTQSTAAVQTETAQTDAPLPEAEQLQETEPVWEQNLYLTVSSITFSVVGESENIYLGLIPVDQVSWESEDPDIVSVENGVLTAEGVGTTVIHAYYYDREVTCTAGCLAQTREELEALDPEILSTPKRLQPEVDLETPCTYFDDAALVGDSITYFLWQQESKNNYLGDVQFLSRVGVSINSLVRQTKNICFEGREMDIAKVIARSGVKRVYILLGCLDYQVPAQKRNLMDNWNKMMDRITETLPDLEVVIISNIPCRCTPKVPEELAEKFNQAVADTAVQIKQMAQERGFGFLDLGYYIQDHTNSMAAVYSKDAYHLNDAGGLVWMQILRYYAQFEEEGGSLWESAD